MHPRQWSIGDRLVHAGRPEWGAGVVTSVSKDSHEGKSCQKVVIRFDRAGVKTISTALADLRPENEMPLHVPDRYSDKPSDKYADEYPVADPFLAAMSTAPKEMMLKVSDEATDPFATSRSRLAATLSLYRFTDQGGSLLDWAVMQSSMRDPMSRFNRHELEDLFKRWVMNRDEHLKRLVMEIKRSEPALLAELGKTAPKGAQQLLRRLDAIR